MIRSVVPVIIRMPLAPFSLPLLSVCPIFRIRSHLFPKPFSFPGALTFFLAAIRLVLHSRIGFKEFVTMFASLFVGVHVIPHVGNKVIERTFPVKGMFESAMGGIYLKGLTVDPVWMSENRIDHEPHQGGGTFSVE